LVQELTKTAWLAVDAGRLRGRQFRLEGSTIMMGRAEENPVGLFGDPGVQPRHAVIERRADGYALKNLAVQTGTFINGNRVETAVLHDGDRIKISNYELSFRERAGTPGRLAEVQPRVPLGVAAPAPVTASAATPPSAPDAARISAGAAYLIAANGERITLRAGTGTQVGRALDNDIVVNDASVSRHHAVIEALNGAFTVRDLGSQNGTWMRGERINQAPITEGDVIKFGDTIYTFHRCVEAELR
jgi:ABC transport system ATP-binding/permease protein